MATHFICFQKTSVDLEEDWDDIKIYDDNPKVQAQIEDLSTENKSLAREVAFLKETIKVRDHPLHTVAIWTFTLHFTKYQAL